MIVVSAAPYRVSLFGGGTDYQGWYEQHGGRVVSSGTNRYVYTIMKYLPPHFRPNYRIVWNKIEETYTASEIQNPIAATVLSQLAVGQRLEMHYMGDLAANSGLGSSSSFAVSAINAVTYLTREKLESKLWVAKKAIEIERVILNEAGGIQDQIAAAYGGFNDIKIHNDGSFDVRPLTISSENLECLNSHFLVFSTGMSRSSAVIAASQEKNVSENSTSLRSLMEITERAVNTLETNFDPEVIGAFLDSSWELKRGMSSDVTNELVDEIIAAGKSCGAYGAKLLGAGGGGTVLFIASPDKHSAIRDKLRPLAEYQIKLGHFTPNVSRV